MKWKLLGSIGLLHLQLLTILWLWGTAMSRSPLTSSPAAAAMRRQQHATATELETETAKTATEAESTAAGAAAITETAESTAAANTRDIVVIKWGGGLITDKGRLKTPLVEIMNMLAQSVLQCHEQDIDVIVVHGAGSFGHLRAKQWKLQEVRSQQGNHY
jgi:hypothetical protein